MVKFCVSFVDFFVKNAYTGSPVAVLYPFNEHVDFFAVFVNGIERCRSYFRYVCRCVDFIFIFLRRKRSHKCIFVRMGNAYSVLVQNERLDVVCMLCACKNFVYACKFY